MEAAGIPQQINLAKIKVVQYLQSKPIKKVKRRKAQIKRTINKTTKGEREEVEMQLTWVSPLSIKMKRSNKFIISLILALKNIKRCTISSSASSKNKRKSSENRLIPLPICTRAKMDRSRNLKTMSCLIQMC